MIRKAIIVVLTVFAIANGIMWLLSYEIDRPSVFRLVVLPFEWGDPEDGTYRKVVFTAIRGAFSAYSYVQVASNRRRNLFAYELGSLCIGQSSWKFMQYSYANAPAWVPTAVFMIYPSIAFIGGPLRSWRRSRKGLCMNCGYDLTGNESGVCPECGSVVPDDLLENMKDKTTDT